MKITLIPLLSVAFALSLAACENDDRGEPGEAFDEGVSDTRRTFEEGKDKVKGDETEEGVNDVKRSAEDATD